MKNFFFLTLTILFISCSGLESIFNSGKVNSKNYQDVINFNYDYNLAIVKVKIKSKVYNFLVDTGAPTVISDEIFEDLNVQPQRTTMVSDSQGKIKKQNVVVVPEIKLGNLTYNKIGAVVANMRDVFEFNCMKIDGILGANQMAISYWKFDYENLEITITDQLENFNLMEYKDTINFTTSIQKTPYVKGSVHGNTTLFTYDTGFAGNIDLDKNVDSLHMAKDFHSYGSSSIGLYGAKDSVTTRTVKLEDLKIGDISLTPQIADIEDGGLLGNLFMNKHDIILDWENAKIYLKKVKEYEIAQVKSFGLGIRFENNKAVVSKLIQELPIDLELGDQIISINEFDFTNLTDDEACHCFLNINLKDLHTIDITYLQNGISKELQLHRVIILE